MQWIGRAYILHTLTSYEQTMGVCGPCRRKESGIYACLPQVFCTCIALSYLVIVIELYAAEVSCVRSVFLLSSLFIIVTDSVLLYYCV